MPSLANVVGIENVDEPFKDKVIQIAADLKTDPNFMMAVMSFETGGSFSPSVRNKFTRATGLIQFMPATAKGLGTTIDDLAKMSQLRQLDFVEAYLKPFRNRLKTLEDAYMAVLLPKAIGQGPEHVLFKKGTTAYKQNAGLDLDGNGLITVREAAERVRRRFGAPPTPVAVGGATPAAVLPAKPFELSKGMESPEVSILQDELVGMGYMTLAEKETGVGVFGNKTERALKAFQKDVELAETGVYDAGTQAAVRQLNNGVRLGSEGGVVHPMQKRLVASGHLTEQQLDTGRGIFGNKTNRALMQFQLDHQITPSGVLSEETYRALFGTVKVISPAKVHGDDTNVDTVLEPTSGPGYTVYNRESGGSDQFGTAQTINAMKALAAEWALTQGRPLIQYGDISRRGGGRFFNANNPQKSDHATHRDGRAVDLRPMRKDGLLAPTEINHASYDPGMTKQLVLLIRAKFPKASVLFNDPKLVAQGLTKRVTGHHNHLHIQFK
ncbi:MAG TPA: peptidoglycan-binding protein [Pyrinomonadaceae bacterium]|nr:peptidoglycan-binding protein [Pyrinomonadaceae bacterium]